MRYFVVSDIHGHYDELIRELKSNGYDEDNKNHHLIVVGDMCDRGEQPVEVLEFIFSLHKKEKATVVLGNHDTFLLEFFEKNFSRAYFNIRYNGFDKTLSGLYGDKVTMDTELSEIYTYVLFKYHHIYDWLKTLPYYYELDKYIFVHGGVNGDIDDWKDTTIRDMIWSKEYEQTPIKDRIVVAGHQRVAMIREKTKDYDKLYDEHPELFDIMYLDGKILIDGFVEVSKNINVLVLEI